MELAGVFLDGVAPADDFEGLENSAHADFRGMGPEFLQNLRKRQKPKVGAAGAREKIVIRRGAQIATKFLGHLHETGHTPGARREVEDVAVFGAKPFQGGGGRGIRGMDVEKFPGAPLVPHIDAGLAGKREQKNRAAAQTLARITNRDLGEAGNGDYHDFHPLHGVGGVIMVEAAFKVPAHDFMADNRGAEERPVTPHHRKFVGKLGGNAFRRHRLKCKLELKLHLVKIRSSTDFPPMPLPKCTPRTVDLKSILPILAATLFLGACGNEEAPKAEKPGDNRTHGNWRSVSFGGGGYTQNVVFCPSKPERLYAYVDVGGVYRSDNGGETWRMIHGGLPVGDGYQCVRGLAVDAENADRLVIGVGNQWTENRGIFLSTDAGESWKKVLDAQFLGNEQHRSTGFVFAHTPEGGLLAGTAGDGLWSSTDGGETWKLEGVEGFNISDIKVDGKGVVYVCAKVHKMPKGGEFAAGFFTRTTGGEWNKFPAGPDEIILGPDGSLTGVFDAWEIRSSKDGGKTWELDSEGLPLNKEGAKGFTSENRFRALTAGPGFQLVGSTRGTVYRRADREHLWQKVERESVEEVLDGKPWWGRIQPGKLQHFGAAMGTVAVNPANPDNWWMTDWYAIYESKDAGRNWALRIDGIEVTVIHCLAQDPTDPGRVHAGMADNGYVPSADGGMRFEGGKKFLSNMKALALDPSLPGRIYGSGDDGAGEWRAGYLWVSVDGGENWVRSPMRGAPAQSKNGMNSISVRPGSPYEVAIAYSGPIGEGGGVFRSTDGGLTFEPLLEGLEKGAEYFHKEIWGLVSELAHAADGTLVATSHKTGEIHRLPAGESIWQKIEQDLPGKSFQIRANGEHFYLTRSSGGLWRSQDGVSWEQVYSGPCEVLAVDRAVQGRIAVATNGKVELSNDSGATWQNLGTPPFGQISTIGFAGDRLLVGTRGGGFFLTTLSASGEQSVAAKTPPIGLLPVLEEAATPLPKGENKWTKPWRREGQLEATPHTGALGIVLKTLNGAAEGSTGWVFKPTGAEFELQGKWIVEGGNGTVADLALRSYGAGRAQIDWKPLGRLIAGEGERSFKFYCSPHPDAIDAEIVLMLKGDGSVDLHDMAFFRANWLFGTPVAGADPSSR